MGYNNNNILLFISLSLSFISLTLCNQVIFNTSSPCVSTRLCNFTDSNVWIGGLVPLASDSVLIISSSPVELILQSYPYNGAFSVASISIQGPVTLTISGVTLTLLEMIWDGNATVKVQDSTFKLTGTSDYSVGSSLYVSRCVVGLYRLRIKKFQIVDSSVTADTIEGAMEISGSQSKVSSVGLYLSEITVSQATQLTAKSFKLYGKFSVSGCLIVAFQEIFLAPNAVIDYMPSQIGEIYTGNIYLLENSYYGKIIFRKNSRVKLESVGSEFVHFQLEDSVTITVNSHLKIGTLTQGANDFATINAPYGDISFYQVSNFNGAISQGAYNSLFIFNSITMNSTGGLCVNGGHLSVSSGLSLKCNGDIQVDGATLGSNVFLQANSVKTKYISAKTSTINADVTIIYNDGFDGSALIFNDSLVINGNFDQTSGIINVHLYTQNRTSPLLMVSGSISLTKVSVVVAYQTESLFYGGKKLAFASSNSKVIDVIGLLEAMDEKNIYFGVSIKDGTIFLFKSTIRLYQVLVAAAVSLIAIFGVLVYYYRMWLRTGTRVNTNEHELLPLAR